MQKSSSSKKRVQSAVSPSKKRSVKSEFVRSEDIASQKHLTQVEVKLNHTEVQLNEAWRERRVVESLQQDVQVLKKELAESEQIREE